MDAFAGEFLLGRGRADAGVVARMAEQLAPAGAGRRGEFTSADGRLAVGFRGSAVMARPGLAEAVGDATRGITVAFTGAIYNLPEVRDELAGQGARFGAAGDTEVLVHLYARRGVEMVHDLRGAFAMMVFDDDAGRLVLARDRLGHKPLWYALGPDRVVFASEAKALLEHPAIDGALDRQSLVYYLTLGYIPAPRTAWAGVRKLPPGHVLVAGTSADPPRPYWGPGPAEDTPLAGHEPGLVREALTRSVAARMVSGVPVGALLSGGIDSSIIVALMAAAAGAGGGVRTFTAGFAEAEFDERGAARRVAEHCGTQHTELVIRPDAGAAVDQLVGMYDEPLGDSSALPTWLICRAARQYVTVALTGDGGDEVFGGYDRYRALRLARMGPVKYVLTRAAAAVVRPWAPHDERSRLRRWLRFAEALPHPPSVQYFLFRRLFGPEDLAVLLSHEFAAGVDLEGAARWFCDLYERPDVEDEAVRAQYHDLNTYLPDDLVVKAEVASRAASLELRAPMLDHDVVELGLALPPAVKLDARRGKKVLRAAFRDLLPADVLERPKRGFGVPLGDWLRRDLLGMLRETLLDRALADRGIFRAEALAALIDEHAAGKGDHRHGLWALLILARWLAARA